MGAKGYGTILDAATLARLLEAGDCVPVDCRFDLGDPAAGEQRYLEAHIPDARYCHLERDLSAASTGSNGRHPLPSTPVMIALMERLGINNRTQVVAYDDADGMVAARLWWMLRFLGHAPVAVLDGGFGAWRASGLPVRAGSESWPRGRFEAMPRLSRLAAADAVMQAPCLCDARAPARFRGEDEPLDPIAGHIPGARNRWYRRNLDEQGRLRSPQALAPEYRALLGDCPPADAVFYCGSGVSACHNLLAMAHAGLGEGRLYAGSWSEWCASPSRPVAAGDGV